jgi:hypothetical protein
MAIPELLITIKRLSVYEHPWWLTFLKKIEEVLTPKIQK